MSGEEHKSEQVQLSHAVIPLRHGKELAAVGNSMVLTLLALAEDGTHATGAGVGVQNKWFGGWAEDWSGCQTVFETAEGSSTGWQPTECCFFDHQGMKREGNVGEIRNKMLRGP